MRHLRRAASGLTPPLPHPHDVNSRNSPNPEASKQKARGQQHIIYHIRHLALLRAPSLSRMSKLQQPPQPKLQRQAGEAEAMRQKARGH